jgi:hypothetical protein
MSQQTNLNVSPYFDDFDANNDYYKVLFKPGYPVQARELTTLQSILQNQIEKFGQHFFKEGAKVIPGNTAYNALYYAVELTNTYLGVPLSAYISQVVGSKITGQTSGVTAVVEKVLPSNESERGNVTLYVSYVGSSTQNNSSQYFSDGETLTSNIAISSGLLGNSSITAGSPFGITIANNSTSVASAFSITQGVYFIRGQFVNVDSETLILDQYSNKSNYRIGLFVNEQIVNSDQDQGLNDNSQGFNNYSSPGADRLKISVSLFKKSLDDFNDNNFVELATVKDGVLSSQVKTTAYSTITDELARRTYAESGDYYVTPFDVSVKNSLDDGLGSRGIFNVGQFTYGGSTPSDNLSVYQVSPGKAFVRGYEIETISPTFLDSPKPRTTKILENYSVNYNTGPTLKLNRVYGSPIIGIGNTYVLSLRSERVGIASAVAPGKEIGLARVYDFKLESGSYNSTNLNLNQWNISLYDIQTTTEVTLNEATTLTIPTFVKGNSSGATAFLKDSVSNSKSLILYEKNGDFIPNESFSFNGISNGRVAIAVTSYGISDIKSVYGIVGSGSTFSADTIQSVGVPVGLANITPVTYRDFGILNTTLTSTVGVGSTQIFVNDVTGVSVGSSITVANSGIALTTVYVTGVGTTSIFIGTASTAGVGTTSTTLSANIGIGSTTIYLSQVSPALTLQSLITVSPSISNAAITGIGSTYVTIAPGSASNATLSLLINNPVSAGATQLFVSSVTGVSAGSSFNLVRPNLVTTITSGQTVGIGSTQIFVTSLSGVAIGNSISVGAAITNVPIVSVGTTSVFIGAANASPTTLTAGTAVTFSLVNYGIPVVSIGIGSTSLFIGTASTISSAIGIGSTLSFTNVSSMVVGTAASFSNVSTLVVGAAVSFTNPLYTSTVTSPNTLFPGTLVRKDNVVSYSNTNTTDPFYSKVVSVGSTSITIGGFKLPNLAIGIATVSGICDGALPTTSLSVTDFKILTTNLETSTDNTLYTKLPKNNISSVDLTNASLVIRKKFTVNISGNQLSTPVTGGTNETFLPFDTERYSLIRSDGTTEVLTADKFSFISGSSQLQIYNLGSNNTGATLIATLTKIKPKSKIKRKNRVNSILIDKSIYSSSGIGSTTLNDGLSYGNYPYGTRVQDQNISLNVSDIIEVHAIYESLDTANPSSPTVVLSSINGPSTKTSDLIIGEKFTGQTSGAIGICAERLTDSQIAFVSKNNNSFKEGETIIFEESKVSAVIVTLNSPSLNVSSNFTFTNGQNGSFYNYGFLTRKSDVEEITKKLKVYFSNGYYESSDDGDITTINSYSTFDYGKEIQTVNGVRNSDIIDIRPKTSDYSVAEGSRSPLEFYGRSFNGSGNSATNILASDESILTSFSFYLGRIDRIYLTKDGKMQVKYGTPSEKFEKPVSVDDALEIATITLPPYLYNVSQASIEFLEHKRYRMVDIKQLENRIKNIEYYTTLSLLETNTANLFVSDSDGLNRFKSGFFVDNFTSLLAQENSIEFKNSIDLQNKEIRPQHYTNSIDLIPGPVVGIDPTDDLQFLPIEGINVRKSGDIVTLDYAEVEWFKQTFATKSESVTPFLVSFWQGTVELSPSSDTWVDTVRLQAKIINTEGNYAETLAIASRTLNVNPQTGFSPTLWNSWQTIWTGTEVSNKTETRREISNWSGSMVFEGDSGTTGGTFQTISVIQDNLRETIDTGIERRTGTRTIVSEQLDKTSVGDKVVSRNLVAYMRSRNVQFISKKVKPLTQLYAFFDGVDVTKYCIPKLLQITMISGVFQVGEKVIGKTQKTGLGLNTDSNSAGITFRVAQSNHKEGPYNAAVSTFAYNPYTSQILQGTYSSTSNILNIDTFSLANQQQGEYSGYIESGMTLIGQTSGAQATITDVKLISDLSATLIGSLFIPNPNNSFHPRFECGTKTFTIVNNNLNDQNAATTIAEEGFVSSGILETIQENIISVRNARIQNKQEFEDKAVSRTTGTQIVSSNTISKSTTVVQRTWYDPLAQSFLVEDETGVFLTRCDIFFRTKDDMDIPVTFQLRTMQNGFPTQKVLPFSEVILDPADVRTSGDGSVATSFTFKSPVYVEGGKDYCVCLASDSTKYSVYIARIGEYDLLTQTYISNQPTLGSLFKSQNASTWEASQWEDLKFTLYRADFLTSGTVEFYNPELTEGNHQIAELMPNSLNTNSRRVRIGIGSTLIDSGLTFGNTILQYNTNASGNYVDSAGIATGSLSINNSGIGYTPSSGSYTFNNTSLTTITGNGRNATANITISNGVAIAATIVNGGIGYKVGDVLGITTIGASSVGSNARLSVGIITGINELILDNVQGDFAVGAANTIRYVNNVGITTNLNQSSGGNVAATQIITENDGLHIKINHKNHGMYFSENYVDISGVESDIAPTKLSLVYNSNSTSAISVESISNLNTFEGVGVGTTNLGYILIGDEVISYTSVSGSTIGGVIVRGTNPKNYPAGTPVYKYELAGVSLNRINTTHNLENVTISDPITFDSYNIKLDMSTNGTDRSVGTGFPKLYQNKTKSTGGYNIKATQNMPFELVTPMVHNLTVQGTNLTGEMRTVTGQSMSGNEIPYVDNGYESITLNKTNYLDSTRIIASKVNETAKLSNLTGNKSLNMRLTMSTVDSKLTPVIDTQRINLITTSNRVNSVITNYATDNRVNSISDDPTAFQYISKEIVLENSASSILILLNANINIYSDIRAFYATSQNENFNPIFVPFPGYNNLDTKKQIINQSNNDGNSDTFISPSTHLAFLPQELEYKEYSFSVDQLSPFRSYRIKIVMTSTNQVYPPRFKDLRVIALA